MYFIQDHEKLSVCSSRRKQELAAAALDFLIICHFDGQSRKNGHNLFLPDITMVTYSVNLTWSGTGFVQ